jgi:glutamate carboxypeptidase
LIVAVTPNEEVGAIGWEETFRELSAKSVAVLGLEPSFKGGVVEGRKGNVWFEIEVSGKEAHAGVNHELGLNACNLLARKMVRLEKLTDYSRKVTVSVGRIEGGQDKYNIVCGWARAKMDSRVPDRKTRDRLVKEVARILKDPSVRFKITDETVPMASNAESRPWIKKLLDLIRKEEGGDPRSHFSGGVGDVNHYYRDGLVVIDGLGPVGTGMHTPEETIDLRTIPTRARVLARFLEQFP